LDNKKYIRIFQIVLFIAIFYNLISYNDSRKKVFIPHSSEAQAGPVPHNNDLDTPLPNFDNKIMPSSGNAPIVTENRLKVIEHLETKSSESRTSLSALAPPEIRPSSAPQTPRGDRAEQPAPVVSSRTLASDSEAIDLPFKIEPIRVFAYLFSKEKLVIKIGLQLQGHDDIIRKFVAYALCLKRKRSLNGQTLAVTRQSSSNLQSVDVGAQLGYLVQHRDRYGIQFFRRKVISGEVLGSLMLTEGTSFEDLPELLRITDIRFTTVYGLGATNQDREQISALLSPHCESVSTKRIQSE
jgi:hypothetical protein